MCELDEYLKRLVEKYGGGMGTRDLCPDCGSFLGYRCDGDGAPAYWICLTCQKYVLIPAPKPTKRLPSSSGNG